jgi:hypothetical protein
MFSGYVEIKSEINNKGSYKISKYSKFNSVCFLAIEIELEMKSSK